ncbi:transcriptional regulator with XRE-family HTH domain [Pullulanibacillus pueri]|uniref:HTH cro/C1-type domain-containing protein n=1 Tax=Pullulanibacillus pueri TaxID=1437324 RepID=A0A8J2ZWE2_9BACL|nr:helix-turn-helix transcriptional regulator [Pullulanibacillus pueri]MBM7682461.1 transcriptional regulator with XRE-family HTH domain [Pullulanibacillus pueri]GGH81547.1 hypothetical protein GCM10007096_19600 [Pullulanibacillus pueri]
MLDARVTGSYISDLRKKADLTQVELAERLNVSHQAVSKWERGESLPDIGTLLEIAKQFNTTVDTLLSGRKSHKLYQGVDALIEKVATKQPQAASAMINNGEADVEGLIEIAPITKTSALQEVAGGIHRTSFSVQHLIDLAPFLERETLNTLVHSLETEDVGLEAIIDLAPFISPERIVTLLENIKEETLDFHHLSQLAPFLRKHLDGFIKRVTSERLQWSDIENIAPFVQSNTLAELIEETMSEPPEVHTIISLAPFLRQELSRWFENFNLKELKWVDIMGLAPFIGRENLDALLENFSETSLRPEQVLELAPFVSRGKLTALIPFMSQQDLTPDFIAEIAPFIDKQLLSQLVNSLSQQK